jgi:two-component system sensor histidine kinase BaeS
VPGLGGRRILLLDEHLGLLASAPPIQGERTVTRLPDGALRIETKDAGTRQVAIIRAPLLPVTASDGSTVARLLVLPTPGVEVTPDDARAHRLVGSLTRNLAVAAALAIAVALGVGILLARRLSQPIEALTQIARGLGEGRRGERAPIRAPREVAELSRAFNGLADALERTEAARRRMVGDVAHELRTPLTRLRGQVEALRDGLLPLDMRTVESLYEEALLLSRLVEDVQQLAEADARGLPLREADIDLGELVRRAAAAIDAQARQAGVSLSVESTVAAPLRADAERLTQVLGNLLANALAHLAPGGTLSVRAREGAHASVELEVQDDGAGIAAEHLPQVFDRFYRADPSRSRRDGGSGLGLAIVREIAEAHGGTATIASEPGRGTTVTVRLPRRGRDAT